MSLKIQRAGGTVLRKPPVRGERMMKMDKQAIKEKVQAIVAAPSCCPELKAAGEEWLAAVGTAREKAASEKLIAELEADVLEVDQVLAFFASREGQKLFGAEKAAKMAQHMREGRRQEGSTAIAQLVRRGGKSSTIRPACYEHGERNGGVSREP